jgi:hypothetical protein
MALAGLLVLTLWAANSCVYVHTSDGTTWHFGGSDKAKYEREVPLAAPLAAGSTFSADTPDGSITVRGVETAECKVVAKIVAHARTEERAQELAEQIEVRLEPAGNGLKTVVEGPHSLTNAWYSVSLEVQVPAQTRLTLSTRDGSVHVTGIVADVDAKTSDGGIEAQDLKGNVKLDTADGGITGTRIEGAMLDVHAGDGGITLTSIRADSVNARTGDGGINCRGIAAQRIECHTNDGSIHLEYAPDGPKAPDVTASTGDGGITFVAPPGLSATLDASTGDGAIHTSLPLTLKQAAGKSLTGTLGAGEGKVRLKTNDGSITIR